MSNTVIKVENLGKLYKLGEISTGSISQDIHRWWAKMRGKEDPFTLVGEENDRSKRGGEYVWALKNVNFKVAQGEVLGIIGENGAGKSTLLKILSKITKPTVGHIKLNGRIASLLEVGTGFHPELTGAENIYLNGAILGMRKAEIRSKFDQIVQFSGVERYIDTPVKRYSSGMYVRLAFAVAAFLEPDILIVDEVLAVGDVEFQKKCIGRMKEVSINSGRTVLFVSHDLGAVAKLCDRTVLMNRGTVEAIGETNNVIKGYLSSFQHLDLNTLHRMGNGKIRLDSLMFTTSDEITSVLNYLEPVCIRMTFEVFEDQLDVQFGVCFNNLKNERVTSVWSGFIGRSFNIFRGKYTVVFEIKSLRLLPDTYKVISFINRGAQTIERIDNLTTIEVVYTNSDKSRSIPNSSHGYYMEEFNVCLQ